MARVRSQIYLDDSQMATFDTLHKAMNKEGFVPVALIKFLDRQIIDSLVTLGALTISGRGRYRLGRVAALRKPQGVTGQRDTVF